MLWEKRNEINKKEYYIDRALKNSEKKYEIDYRAFIDFIEEIKKKDKKEEEILNKLKSKKESTEIVLNNEIILNKKLEEKCENIVPNENVMITQEEIAAELSKRKNKKKGKKIKMKILKNQKLITLK